MKKETGILIVKVTTTIVAGVAVAAVATAACKRLVPLEGLTKLNNPVFNKVIFNIGTFVISGIAADAGMKYANNFVDSLTGWINNPVVPEVIDQPQ